MRTVTVIIITLCLVSGCRTGGVSATQSPPAPKSVAADFERVVRDRGSVTFRSWNGQALRMDSDTELTFYPDHSVHMFEWGLGLSSYDGTYHVHDDGCVVAHFKAFDQEWPVTVVYRDAGTFMLRPWDPDSSFVMGNRGGATLPGGKVRYWPFRMLTGEDEKKVLDMIEKRPDPPPK